MLKVVDILENFSFDGVFQIYLPGSREDIHGGKKKINCSDTYTLSYIFFLLDMMLGPEYTAVNSM